MKYIMIFALAVSLAACGSSEKTTTMELDGKDVTIKQSGDGEDASISMKGADGEAVNITTGGAAAGGALPAGVASYPGSKALMSMTGNQDGKAGGMTVLETTDSPDKVLAFYKAEAAKQGLTADVSETKTTADGQAAYSYAAKSADKKMGLMVTIGSKDGKTQVTLMGGSE
jgi:major membrane immunogen (membrane-anchored lipoprotein)